MMNVSSSIHLMTNTYVPFNFIRRFQVKKKQFFHNFLTIMLFGVTGVFISSSIVAAGNSYIYTLGSLNNMDMCSF